MSDSRMAIPDALSNRPSDLESHQRGSPSVAQTRVLVPVRYPLTKPSMRTVREAIELVAEFENAALCFLHVNLLQQGDHVTTKEFKRAIEDEFGPLPEASFNVNQTFILEEEILKEAREQQADYIVIGQSLRGRLQRLLAKRLGQVVDLESFLQGALEAKIVVV